MATPQAVARDLHRTADQLVAATEATIKEASTFAVAEASSIGGQMRDGTRLTAEDSTSAAGSVVRGVPAGAWVLKSYGRRGGYRVRATGRPLDLRDGGGDLPGAAWAASIDRATQGDGRWDRVIEATEQEAGDRFQANVKAATDG